MISVNFFHRKPRKGFNFSIEQIFERIRKELEGSINSRVLFSQCYNTGYWSKLVNILEARRMQGAGVDHITGEIHYLNLLMKPHRVVLTIHDCRMVQRKSGVARHFVKWLYLDGPVKRSAIVTTVSRNTKNEIIKYTGCDPLKIRIIYNPISSIFKANPKPFASNCCHILQIGTGPNKNLDRLIPALHNINCVLTIVGKLTGQQVELLKKFNINYTNVSNISNEELYECYRACDILTFISTFEGFGMPIVEAQAVERVVITSNCSSMPEIAGDGACLVDPYNIEDIRSGFLKIITDFKYRTQLIERGRENRKRFDVQAIAKEYLNVYQELSY